MARVLTSRSAATAAVSLLQPSLGRWRGLAAGAGSPATPNESSWPVVIAGGGPVGLTLSSLLSHYGVPSLLLERSPELTTHPRAHFINHRTMEVLRGMGGLAKDVERTMPPLQQWRNFVYCTTLTGELLGIVDHFKGQNSPSSPNFSPEPCAHLAQHKLLPMMAARAASSPGIDLRMGHSVTRMLRQDADSVQIEVESEAGDKYTVKTQYLVAADGAHSPLRKALGISMPGPGAMQHLINIHFISEPLGAALRRMQREGMLYFAFGRGAIAVMVAHDLNAGEFVAQVPYFPPLQSAADFTQEVCIDLVRRIAGDSSIPVDVRTVRAWAMSAATAEQYKAGRVLLAGDAAHVVPPSGAMGLNTGVQDAHNLAWKLATAVTTGNAAVLESYGPERRPVAESNMRLSVANFHEALEVARVMGLDYSAANMLSDALASKAAAGVLPAALRRSALDAAITVGRAASGAIAALRRNELAELFSHGDTLRLQYPKEDLGFIYSSPKAAVLCEGPDAKSVLEYTGPKPRDAPYQPTTLPGARCPHFELSIVQPGAFSGMESGRKVSSIDLPPEAGLGFPLLLSPGPRLGEWTSAAAEWNRGNAGAQVCPVVIAGPGWRVESIPESVALAIDGAGRWEQLRGVGASAAVLVRPDGHVAWRGGGADAEGVGGKVDALARATHAVLGGGA